MIDNIIDNILYELKKDENGKLTNIIMPYYTKIKHYIMFYIGSLLLLLFIIIILQFFIINLIKNKN